MPSPKYCQSWQNYRSPDILQIIKLRKIKCSILPTYPDFLEEETLKTHMFFVWPKCFISIIDTPHKKLLHILLCILPLLKKKVLKLNRNIVTNTITHLSFPFTYKCYSISCDTKQY